MQISTKQLRYIIREMLTLDQRRAVQSQVIERLEQVLAFISDGAWVFDSGTTRDRRDFSRSFSALWRGLPAMMRSLGLLRVRRGVFHWRSADYNPPHTVKYFCLNPELQNDRVKLRDQWAAEEAYMQREFTRAIQAVRNIPM